mmetsp:Transcript_89224/g.239086  ORF Transcript_89224/g.239086 Transcript_89224/m.239086 type:complete len:249 (+) Transcript_89224:300-1046(+)
MPLPSRGSNQTPRDSPLRASTNVNRLLHNHRHSNRTRVSGLGGAADLPTDSRDPTASTHLARHRQSQVLGQLEPQALPRGRHKRVGEEPMTPGRSPGCHTFDRRSEGDLLESILEIRLFPQRVEGDGTGRRSQSTKTMGMPVTRHLQKLLTSSSTHHRLSIIAGKTFPGHQGHLAQDAGPLALVGKIRRIVARRQPGRLERPLGRVGLRLRAPCMRPSQRPQLRRTQSDVSTAVPVPMESPISLSGVC